MCASRRNCWGAITFCTAPWCEAASAAARLDFPTANLESETECLPPDGVYATRVVLDNGHYGSITNIGMRPTFNETARSIEAHIFEFNRDIYGHRIKLELIERIRGEKKFASADELKQQIAQDLNRVREILASA